MIATRAVLGCSLHALRTAFAWWAVAFALLGSFGANAQDVLKMPALARVVDETNTLSSAQRQALQGKLEAFETAHGSQIAVVIVPTTQPEPIEVYGNRLGESWKLGRAGVGDGVLLIVAKNDKRVRIEVARTLEGALPDARAKQIIRETISPAFSQGNFYAGIDAAVDRIFAVVEGEALAPNSVEGRAKEVVGPKHASTLASLAPVFLFALFIGGMLRGVLGRVGGVLAGLGAAGAAWLFVGLPLLGALILGLFVAAVVSMLGGGRGFGGFPLVVGSGWGGGGGGGGSSGGWTSGGGGDFSGGGASGSWD